MSNGKTVWVTGASSGLGLHTAMALRDAGWTVIAGARSFADGTGRRATEAASAVAEGAKPADFSGPAASTHARVRT